METVTPAAPAAEVTPAPAVNSTPAADPNAPEHKPERTFSQAELDEIVEKRLAKEKRKRSEVETRLKVTEELALKRAERERAETPPAKPQTEGEPTRDQYDTYEQFIEARADWRAEQKVNKKFEERDAKDRERTASTKQEQEREAFRKAMKESAKDIADFDEVMSGIKADDPVANVSATAIEAAELPGKILHYLAKNPDEAERIASLSPGKQAREIVRLEEKLAKPPVKPSKAPDPITPVGGKAAVGDEMPDAAKDPEGWVRWRNRDLAAKRKGPRVS
jgi:hypothetical protein